MSAEYAIATDLARVYSTPDGRGYIRTLAWGDQVDVHEITPAHVSIGTVRYEELSDGSIRPTQIEGFIVPRPSTGIDPQRDVVAPLDQSRVLKVNTIDVGQGDGMVIETPSRKVILIDGGDNQLFARYLAGRYRGTSIENPLEVACIVVSHGDADHFVGLTRIFDSETEPFDADEQYKRVYIAPRRVYHNGLVKRPSSVPEGKSLGATVSAGEQTIITGLEENLLQVADSDMNEPFRAWKAALAAYNERSLNSGAGGIEFRRLAKGDDQVFDFLADDNINVEVLGPILTVRDGVRGLLFLGNPRKRPERDHDGERPPTTEFTGKSASHTINGHSIVLRLTYGAFRLLLSGDVNQQADERLVREHLRGEIDLTADVVKVPHHGSDDFSIDFLKAVSPVVSIVSSGDESARKEFIHPRATLMSALGRASRCDDSLIFVTELVAFFNAEGFVTPELHEFLHNVAVVENGQAVVKRDVRAPFYAFRRAAFGAIKMRTDGRRLLVYTDSGNLQLKEAYVYELGNGVPRLQCVRQA